MPHKLAVHKRYLAEDGFDVDGKVTVRTAESTHDTEAQSVRPSLQTNALTLRRTGQNRTMTLAGFQTTLFIAFFNIHETLQ